MPPTSTLPPRNVLIFHGGALGDLVLSFPLALALARLHPTSRVRYVTTSGKGRLAHRMLGVEHVNVEAGFSGLFADGAAIPPAVETLLAGSHRIISFVAGPDTAWANRVARLAPHASLMFATTVPPQDVWAVDHLRAQCARERALSGAVDQILALIGKQGLVRPAPDGGRGVVVHPGAGAPAKCWPLDRFRDLALRLKGDGHEVRWVLGEVERERMPPADRRALDILGDVSVPDSPEGLLEELTSASLVIGNDSGPCHLAGISGVPTVSLYGPTDPAMWKPLGPHVQTARAGDTMADLEVEAVLAAISRVREPAAQTS